MCAVVLAVLAIGTIKKRERDILALVIVCALVLAVLAIGTIKRRQRYPRSGYRVRFGACCVSYRDYKKEREFLMCCPFWLVPNKEKRENGGSLGSL